MRVSLLPLILTLWPGVGAETVRFDTTPAGKLPPGWTVAREAPAAKWEVLRDASAPSRPNVLAQLSVDGKESHCPLAILNTVHYRDGEVGVKFKTIAGKADQAAGIVWRYKDPGNYYLVRVNAIENNIAMYKVEGGNRVALVPRGRSAKTYEVRHKIPHTWNVLKVSFKRSRFEVYFDHKKVFEVEDATFLQPGKVGLWTRADSVTYFDDFQVSGR